jgi:two-component system, NarL family, nitrate/nitrite response regulator NarL
LQANIIYLSGENTMTQLPPMLPAPIRVMVVENHQLILWALIKLIDGHRPLMEVVSIADTQSDALLQVPVAEPHVVLIKHELIVLSPQAALPEALTCGRRTLLYMEELAPEMMATSLCCGAHGLLSRRSGADEIIKAIEKTHQGEFWFGREATGIALNVLRGGDERRRTQTTRSTLDALTRREQKVLQAIIANKVSRNKDLAKQLFISESTLRNHLSAIYQKLGVSNKLDLYVYAQSHLVANSTEMA